MQHPEALSRSPSGLSDTDSADTSNARLAARVKMMRKQSSDMDLFGEQEPTSPKIEAAKLTVHELLSIASDALEVAAHMEHDDLDLDDNSGGGGGGETRPRSTTESDLGGRPRLMRTPSSNMQQTHESHLDEEVEDLAHLDEAFEHLADRFKRRLSVRMLDDFNNQDHEIREPSRTRAASIARHTKKWRKNNLAAIWSHHIEHGLLVFYQVPMVRQFYEDTQHEHEVDWADLFFDLTYVAAAYQLGEKLKADVTWSGFLNSAIVGVCMLDSWKFKTLHDSTFEATDVVHKVFDVLYVTSVAFAAIFISPLEDMEDMSSGFAFGFSVSLTCNALILGLEKLEIIMKSHSKAAQGHCRMGILMEVLPRFSCFLAASLMTGLKWARGRGHIDTAGGYSYSAVAWLLAGAHVLGTLFPLFGYLFKLLPASPIPWHYQHIAHRYGELIMLMLGEGVLSMILVPVVVDGRFYATFAIGLVTIQLLQLVHFETEEFDPLKHALSRKLRAGRIWLELMTVNCLALICFGVALKLMLKSLFCTDDKESGYRRELAPSEYSSSSSYGTSYSGGESSKEEKEYCTAVPQEYKTLLCLSLLIQYLSQQISIPLHEGMAEYLKHFMEYSKRSARFIFAAKAFVVSVTLLLNFLPLEMNALQLVLSSFFIVLVQGLIQTLENMIVHVRREEHEARQPSQNREQATLDSWYRHSTSLPEDSPSGSPQFDTARRPSDLSSDLSSDVDKEPRGKPQVPIHHKPSARVMIAEENKEAKPEPGETFLHFDL